MPNDTMFNTDAEQERQVLSFCDFSRPGTPGALWPDAESRHPASPYIVPVGAMGTVPIWSRTAFSASSREIQRPVSM